MKKILFLSFTATLLFLAPFVHAEIAPGSLVTCADSPDIYVVSEQYENRLVLLKNELVFASFGYQWNDIVPVSCDEFDGMSISYKNFNTDMLLKFVGSPEVYEDRMNCSYALSRTAQGCADIFYHIPNEQVAAELYGAQWQNRILEVPESYRSAFGTVRTDGGYYAK